MSPAASSPADGPVPPPARYPPQNHILRHLRLSHQMRGDGTLTATMPVLDDLADGPLAEGGWLRLGAVATLVDSVAGHHAVLQVTPDWSATLHLSTVLAARAEGEVVTARCSPLRVGRNQVVTETSVTDESGTEIARSTCTYARLPRRDDTPVVDSTARENTVDYREDHELDPRPALDDYLRITPVPGEPRIELPMHNRIRNSFGSLQGGASIVVAEVMANHLARMAAGGERTSRCVFADVHYLAPGRGGPFRVDGETLARTDHLVTTRTRIFETAGDADRLLQTATATAAYLD
ncbi:MAG: PaaI family thioesterase [Acidimicrobiales bacterium]|nr:PaaI family thioesterase [Acidimicrobiaceae bacterium]MXV86951.1 PaaI family thioesterase [Acidimicrobiales bacterium]MCY3894292.1 PaaI family thioesterase [Acidimicrobiaceae bacterium]MYA81257.1 PaaI family thioesterase [Acidimicrobiales bacterium]MYB80885.1 PaaI family thioesterase [Acidimicrobiales bacterium]